MTVGFDPETDSFAIAVEEGGLHAAEGMILARYMMFTQVYFQHTRRAYDHHVKGFLKSLLVKEKGEDATFPPPTSKDNIEEYLEWTDWKALGLLAAGEGGEDGQIIRDRNHHRDVFETKEVPDKVDLELLEEVIALLGDEVAFVDDPPEVSWYKIEKSQIRILQRAGQEGESMVNLSQLSNVVDNIAGISQKRVYVSAGNKQAASDKVATLLKERRREKE